MLNPFLASSLIFLFLLYQEFHTHLHIGKERMGEGEGKKSEIYMLFNQGLIIIFFFLPKMLQRFTRQKY